MPSSLGATTPITQGPLQQSGPAKPPLTQGEAHLPPCQGDLVLGKVTKSNELLQELDHSTMEVIPTTLEQQQEMANPTWRQAPPYIAPPEAH